MKHIVFTVIFIGFTMLSAQTNIKVGESATIKSDADLNFLLEKNLEKSDKTDKVPGFRIQIISSNSKSDVMKERDKVVKDFKHVKDYVTYDQPYYKLRMGDFRTRLEALKFLEEIAPLYPSAFLVKDEVKIK